jgi:hypothetical protein
MTILCASCGLEFRLRGDHDFDLCLWRLQMKNRDLCERPYCRERWTHTVSGFNEHWKRGWTLRVCDEHVKEYKVPPSRYHSTVWASVSPRPKTL